MSTIREKLELYDYFTKDNNPYGERDFGSPDPADASVTTRLLTIITASEY